MNTFFNIYQELGINICFHRREMGLGMWAFDERRKTITSTKRIPLNRRITQRGNTEQYQNKFLTNYYGEKRLSRSHVFTANTI